MNEKKIIVSKFRFLEDMNYRVKTIKLSHSCIRVEYARDNLSVCISFDAQDDHLAVTLINHKFEQAFKEQKHNIELEIISHTGDQQYIFENEELTKHLPKDILELGIIGDDESREIRQEDEELYAQVKNQKRGMTKSQLEGIVQRYAELVQTNILAIEKVMGEVISNTNLK